MEKTVLQNGLTIYTESDDTAKVCTLSYIVKTGSRNETDDERGLAHLVEHLLFKGTTHRNYKQISQEIEGLGGYLNACTTYHFTKYYCSVPKDYWKNGLDVLSDMILYNAIPEDQLEKEKNVVMEELKMYTDDPSSFINSKLTEKLFENYPSMQMIGGTIDTVKKLDRQHVINFIDKHYVPKNMIFIATGNINHSEIVKFINNYFTKDNIQFMDYNQSIPEYTPEKLNFEIYEYDRNNIEQAHLAWGMLGPKANDKDTLALDVLSVILGGNSSSKLYNDIREEKGLAYTISMNYEQLDNLSIISGYAGLNSEAEDVISSIWNEIKNVMQDLTEEDLNRAKKYIQGMLFLMTETTSKLNDFITDGILVGTSTSVEEICNKYENVTLEDLNNAYIKYFNKDNICFVSLKNRGEN